MRFAAPRRPGFTLLEVLVAALLTTLVLAAAYVAFDMCLRQTSDSRVELDGDAVAAGIHKRVQQDLNSALGPLPPKSGPSQTSSAAGTDATAASAIDWQAGVIGTPTQLTIYASRLPRQLRQPGLLGQDADPTQAEHDVVRIVYYMSDLGLCREVREWVTSADVLGASDPDMQTVTTDLIAEEVTSVSFKYLGPPVDVDAAAPTSWEAAETEWNGGTQRTKTVGDSQVNMGPRGAPRAIEMTLTIRPPGGDANAAPKTVVHRFVVRTAPGAANPSVVLTTPDETMTDPDTTDPAAGTGGGGQ